MSSLQLLNNEQLLSAYQHAVRIEADKEFIEWILEEIKRRNLTIPT